MCVQNTTMLPPINMKMNIFPRKEVYLNVDLTDQLNHRRKKVCIIQGVVMSKKYL